jgi:hypothetical protein
VREQLNFDLQRSALELVEFGASHETDPFEGIDRRLAGLYGQPLRYPRVAGSIRRDVPLTRNSAVAGNIPRQRSRKLGW